MLPIRHSEISTGCDCFTTFTDCLPGLPATGFDPVFLLCDDNTRDLCLPVLEAHLSSPLPFSIFTVPPGEKHKEMDTAIRLLDFMMEKNGNRHSILVNLGGGIISDLGGFTASIFKRGIRYINIPTTLTSQIDAAIGGKTGVNLNGIKNQAGTIWFPSHIFIYPAFLETLPETQFKSGLGEIFKYAMIGACISASEIEDFTCDNTELITSMIRRCVRFKESILKSDPYEVNRRKMLNFGHTIGHAIEAATAADGHPVTHGEAVAAGIIAETWLSVQLMGTDPAMLETATSLYRRHFVSVSVGLPESHLIMQFMVHDKKIEKGQIQPVMLNREARPVYGISVDKNLILDSLSFLADIR